MNWIDDTAQKITDHFFQCGARIKKEDYDTVRTALQEAHTKGTQEALKPFKGALNPGEWEDSVWHDGKNVGTQEALAKVEEWVNGEKEIYEAVLLKATIPSNKAIYEEKIEMCDDLLHHLQQLKDNK